MFDLGDNLTIESYRIPWLIWIQILIFFFLIFLFYCFSSFTSDLSHNNSSSSSLLASASTSSSSLLASASSSSYLNNVILKHNNTTVRNRLQHNQVRGSQSIKGEMERSLSPRIVREESSVIGEGFSTRTIIEFHPCNYFRLAKLAFLKCFGFDSASENSSSPEP